MFYEHEEIHKFWAKEVITKRKNILAVNLTPSIAEGLIRQGTAALQAGASIHKEGIQHHNVVKRCGGWFETRWSQ